VGALPLPMEDATATSISTTPVLIISQSQSHKRTPKGVPPLGVVFTSDNALYVTRGVVSRATGATQPTLGALEPKGEREKVRVFHQKGLRAVSARLSAPGRRLVDTGGEFALAYFHQQMSASLHRNQPCVSDLLTPV
jgi:hypothetical protein